MPRWLRVRDPDTGHEYDLRDDDARVADGRVEVRTNYPENSGLTARPRPAKFFVNKAGRPARRPAKQTSQGDSTDGAAS